MKRVISLMIALAMLFCVLPMNAFAASKLIMSANPAPSGGNYEIVDDTITFYTDTTLNSITGSGDNAGNVGHVNLNNHVVTINEGITSNKQLQINGPGTLIISSTNSGDKIKSDLSMLISGCDVYITSTDLSSAIGSTSGDCKIINSNINVYAGADAIYAQNIDIENSTVNAISNGNCGLYTQFNLNIDVNSNLCTIGGSGGIVINDSTGYISPCDYCWSGSETTDGQLLEANFANVGGQVYKFKVNGNIAKKVVFAPYAYVPNPPAFTNDQQVEEHEDPQAEVVIGGKNMKLEYGNDAVVLDKETYFKTKNAGENANSKNYILDFTNASVDVEEAIIPNAIIKDLIKEDKGVEFRNKHGFMVIDELDETTNNSVVIGVKEDVASHAQVKAIGTTHVESEFNIVYKTNGREIDGDAHVYIPCDIKEPRLFYVLDDNTMGELTCEVSGGYAVFDRYLDGTYVVCK